MPRDAGTTITAKLFIGACYFRIVTLLEDGAGVGKSVVNQQPAWRWQYYLSSRAQTCWGHPVRPLLFLSLADEEEDEDDEVALGISSCMIHITCIIIIIIHLFIFFI